uniref:Riboflavin transporter n=1 Tax=Angiostrongylus cantonensis TaxID=6313 RepID=A0A0K0CYM6_ANGCA
MPSKGVFILVVIFGSVSWMGTNSVWMQLPLLTADLPEGWGLPSFLAAVVQVACIGPLVYSIFHKGCKSIDIPTKPLITAFLILSCTCQFGLVVMWWRTILIKSDEYSIALYLLLFGLALVNATSNVLFMPFMAQFHHAYLNAYFVGMGFSSLIPGLLSLIQEHEDRGHEGTPLNVFKSKAFESVSEVTEMIEEVTIVSPQKTSSGISKPDYIIVLIATALVNAQMNGVIPSAQSYAALPYSQHVEVTGLMCFCRSLQATYHYGLTLANLVSPAVSFLPLILAVRSVLSLCFLTFCSSCATAFIVYLASLSPNLIFNSVTIGSILSVGSALLAAGLHSYLRVMFASLLREGEESESRLFWCGVFIQVGSFIGSAVMFPLVNIVSVFTSAPRCR